MINQTAPLYFSKDADLKFLHDRTIAVIGYGNQGRAQALNLRDSGCHVVIGNREDAANSRARADGFEVLDIPGAVSQASIIMLLVPDEVLPAIYKEHVSQNLRKGAAIVFASGYNVAFDQVPLPKNIDVLLLAPRMIGVGVRERYLSGEGFYCFVDVHQDASGNAREILLALTMGISKLEKPAIGVTCKHETILDLFNEQAFGPAFGKVLLTSISVLLDKGLPPEAVLVEMYMSEEMAYTYRKMAQVGLVKQTLYHSQTSQYGAMSRGLRFMDMDVRRRMEGIFEQIEGGDFAREWSKPFTHLKFKVIKFFAFRQAINSIEMAVRNSLGLKDIDDYPPLPDIHELLEEPRIKDELASFESTFKY